MNHLSNRIHDNFRKVFLYFLPFLLTGNSFSQLSDPGKPYGPGFDKNHNVSYFTIPSRSGAQKSVKVTKNFYLKSFIFADPFNVNLSPENSGTWDTLPDKKIIWRLGITAKKASSIGISFRNFHLQNGTKLLVYNPNLKNVLGAFTFRNNNNNNTFATMPLRGDSIIIEMQLSPETENYGSFILNNIGIGKPQKENLKSTEDRLFGSSTDCEVDSRCIIESNLQRQKHSVCRILINNYLLCTGTLINNTAQNGQPYVLTAGHCITDEESARNSIFYFDYESPYCQGPDGPIKSIFGSRLVAHRASLDFTLVELSEKPPFDYNPVYSGWDVSDNVMQYSYTFHHPEGDVKKVNENSHEVLSGSMESFDPNAHWLIPKYKTGTTESGSSGAPLFDSENKLRGTLTGGDTACAPIIDDYYEKLSHSWNDYPDSAEQLKYWLDPFKTGQTSLDNYIPGNLTPEYNEELSNIKTDESETEGKMTNGWGYSSGHNFLFTSEYAEHFYKNGSKYIYALNVDVSHSFPASRQSKIDFRIWSGKNYPEKLLYTKELYLFEMEPAIKNFIRLDSAIYVNQDFFAGYEIFYNNPLDTFAVLIANPRSFQEKNTALVRKGTKWQSLSDGLNLLNTSLAIKPVVLDYTNSRNQDFPASNITVYPNPAVDQLQILFRKQPLGNVRIGIFDLSGRLVLSKSYAFPEPNLSFDVSTLSFGIYLIRIQYQEGTELLKFIKN